MIQNLPSNIKQGCPWKEETSPTIYDENINWPKISIVTPSYNQGQFIEETIRSILLQNYPNLEYIIIDGGSKDDTVEIIKKYEKYITYWVSEHDEGQSHAINKGIEKSTGEIFNWLNSDDFYEKNALFNIAINFINNNPDIVTGTVRVLEIDAENWYITGHYIGKFCKKGYAIARLFQPSTFLLMKKVKQLGEISTELHHVMDVEWYLKYLLYFGFDKICEIDEIIVNYRHHEASKSIAKKDIFMPEIEFLYYRMALLISENKIADFIKKHILVEEIKSLDYKMKLDEKYLNIKILKETLSNFLYKYFSEHYVKGNLKLARKLAYLIEYKDLAEYRKQKFRLPQWRLKNIYPILVTWRRIKSFF